MPHADVALTLEKSDSETVGLLAAGELLASTNSQNTTELFPVLPLVSQQPEPAIASQVTAQ